MKKYLAPLPDFKDSYTHSCNNLASYEVKKNPDPSKKVSTRGKDMKTNATDTNFVKSKKSYQVKKDHATSINDLKTFTKPNLDDGNRFY